MKLYILNKINCLNNEVKTVAVEEVTEHISDDQAYSLIHEHLLDDIQQHDAPNYQSVIVDKYNINIYERQGYFISSKILKFIYNIEIFED